MQFQTEQSSGQETDNRLSEPHSKHDQPGKLESIPYPQLGSIAIPVPYPDRSLTDQKRNAGWGYIIAISFNQLDQLLHEHLILVGILRHDTQQVEIRNVKRHILLRPAVHIRTEELAQSGIDRDPRSWDRESAHGIEQFRLGFEQRHVLHQYAFDQRHRSREIDLLHGLQPPRWPFTSATTPAQCLYASTRLPQWISLHAALSRIMRMESGSSSVVCFSIFNISAYSLARRAGTKMSEAPVVAPER